MSAESDLSPAEPNSDFVDKTRMGVPDIGQLHSLLVQWQQPSCKIGEEKKEKYRTYKHRGIFL